MLNLKPLRAVLFGCLWFSLGLIALPPLVQSMPAEALPLRSWATTLLHLEHNIDKYHNNYGERVILVGASYAANLPEIPGVINFGLAGSSPSENEWIIKNLCAPEDRILYLFTWYDAYPRFDVPRADLVSAVARKRTILRAALAYKMGLTPPVKPRTELDMEVVEKQIQNYFSSPATPSFEPLLKLKRERPDILFVLHPTLPTSLWPDTPESRLGKKQIAQLMASAEALDASNCLNVATASDFIDLFHVTSDCQKAIVNRIQSLAEPSLC